MIKNILDVKYNEIQLGKLALTDDYLCAFEYDSDYLKHGTSISPFHLPLKSGVQIAKRDPFNGLFGVFNDCLPDGWGKLLLDRYFLKLKINPASVNIIKRLAYVGSTGMGALTFHPNAPIIFENDINDLFEIENQVNLILSENYTGSLETLLVKAGSSAGARPKISIKIDNEEWLIKFRSSTDPSNIGKQEYEYSILAKKCGISMPETKLFENKFFGVKRFDRLQNTKVHVHSACGLLNADFRIPSLDYIDLLKATFILTNDINEVYKLFRQMVFNIVMHNRDDHSKNFSFILQNNNWNLSPAYDLVYCMGFNGQHTTTIAGKGIPKFNDVLIVAKEVSISERIAKNIIDEVVGNCGGKILYKL
jgi:serine/threonine-protein kinase HipA